MRQRSLFCPSTTLLAVNYHSHMKGLTASNILVSTHRLIGDYGYSGFSYADLEKIVHIRKASIHHHFPTKAGLVEAVIAEHNASLRAAMQEMDATLESPLDRLAAYVSHWEACISSNSDPFCIAALLAVELPSLPDRVRRVVEGHFMDLHEWVTRTIEAGLVDGSIVTGKSATLEADCLISLVHGAMLSARAKSSPRLFSDVAQCALTGLRSNGR